MGQKHEITVARQLYLYGAGDGKRIVNPAALAKASGVHIETIRKHTKTWEKEVEEMLAGSDTSGLGLGLSAKELKLHKSDMAHLRNLVEANKWEHAQVEEVTAKLEGWVEKFSGDDASMDRALQILDMWVRTCGQKATLQTQFLALQRQYTKLSGVEALLDVAVTREKTIATGKAKIELKAQEGKSVRDATPVRSGFFSLDVPRGTNEEPPAQEQAED